MCTARTDNNILLDFAVQDGCKLEPGEVLEVDLPNLLSTQRLKRRSNGQIIAIEISKRSMFDLDIPMQHGGDRTPSDARLRRLP